MPSVTEIVWPLGWVCHAVRAPGVKWTLLALKREPSDGDATGSMYTAPVNQSLGPALVSIPFLVSCMTSPDGLFRGLSCLSTPADRRAAGSPRRRSSSRPRSAGRASTPALRGRVSSIHSAGGLLRRVAGDRGSVRDGRSRYTLP